jgi:hypothetical protein
LQSTVKIRAFIPLMHLMVVIPVVLVGMEANDLKEQALELYALAGSHPFIANSPLFEDIAGRYLDAAAAALPPVVVEASRARGQSLEWWQTAAKLLETLKELGWKRPSG